VALRGERNKKILFGKGRGGKGNERGGFSSKIGKLRVGAKRKKGGHFADGQGETSHGSREEKGGEQKID